MRIGRRGRGGQRGTVADHQSSVPHGETDIGQYMGATITQATIGGAASVAGGGKFANGAVTGAFQYLATTSYEGAQAVNRMDADAS